MADANETYYYHFDGLGSVVALSDVNNVLVERYAYDVFGRPTIRDANGTEISETAVGNPYLFTARRYDAETALYYYRARYYDYYAGRFLQPDPLGYTDGLNLYAYVGNNPLNWIDPLGQTRVALPKGYVGVLNWMYRGGARMGGHIHVYRVTSRGLVEIAKVNERGGYAPRHGGKPLYKPSQLPRPLRNAINRAVRRVFRGGNLSRGTNLARGGFAFLRVLNFIALSIPVPFEGEARVQAFLDAGGFRCFREPLRSRLEAAVAQRAARESQGETLPTAVNEKK